MIDLLCRILEMLCLDVEKQRSSSWIRRRTGSYHLCDEVGDNLCCKGNKLRSRDDDDDFELVFFCLEMENDGLEFLCICCAGCVLITYCFIFCYEYMRFWMVMFFFFGLIN